MGDQAVPPRKQAARVQRFRRRLPLFRDAAERVRPGDGDAVAADTAARLVPLLARVPAEPGNPLEENLVIAAWFLAFFQALRARGADDAELSLAGESAAEQLVAQKPVWVRRVEAWVVRQGWMQRVLTRVGRRSLMRPSPLGFALEFVSGDGRSAPFGYDVHTCGICRLFAAEGAPELVPLMCRIDYVTSRLAGLELTRTGTIGNGAAKCDFRFSLAARDMNR